jgi:hypothetical protein
MIDVRDDAEIARSLDSHEESQYAGALRMGQFVAAPFRASRKSGLRWVRPSLDRRVVS